MSTRPNQNVELQLPEDLVARVREYVNDGWAASFDEVVAEALRRYLDSHSPELTEKFIRQDVEWGLHGRD